MDEIIEEASKKYQGLVPLVYDIETMCLDEARPQDMPYAVYLKREADKVIEEKDKEIAALKEQVQEERSAKVDYKISANDLSDGLKKAYEELNQQKYKRCLDKAKWCFTKSNYHFVLARHGENGKENNRRSILYAKWHKRWLEIAAKIKEASDD